MFYPEFRELAPFGNWDKSLDLPTLSWPKQEDLQKCDMYKKLYLQKVSWKKDLTNGLRSLKLSFSQGLESPSMDCLDTFGLKLENRTINTSKKIKKISLFIDTKQPAKFEERTAPTYHVWGFKLLDEWGDELICQQWRNQGFEWIDQQIPDGWEIIGFYGDTK